MYLKVSIQQQIYLMILEDIEDYYFTLDNLDILEGKPNIII